LLEPLALGLINKLHLKLKKERMGNNFLIYFYTAASYLIAGARRIIAEK
jgi:hypothetical protein